MIGQRNASRAAAVLFALALLVLAFLQGGPAQQQAPNILLILLDDLGYSDLGANGNPAAPTPHLDAFAEQGVRFTRNYVDSTCSATRAGILTGTPPAARGFRAGGLGISPGVQTLPEALLAAGYQTHHIGKWHLGHATRLAWPTRQGFERFFGFLDQHLLRGPHGSGQLRLARPTYRNPWLQEQEETPVSHKGHLTELLTRRAVDFIRSRQVGDGPWFLNFWTYAPHSPVQPARRYAARHPDTPAGRYLALLEQVDAGVGRILRALERQGLADRTLVIVASDNGGSNRELDNNAPFHGAKMSFFEGGVRTPLLIRWPDGRDAGRVFDGRVSYLDYMPTLLAAASAPRPADNEGRDIAELLAGRGGEQGPLFWSLGSSEPGSWGTLSADGRWRLQRLFTGQTVLNDLRADPAGRADVAQAHPQVLDRLGSAYQDWNRRVRRVSVNYETLGEGGRARLSGEALQRSPGYGGHSFAIGIAPAAEMAGTAPGQVIAFQRGLWQLRRIGDELALEINGVSVRVPGPLPGRCSGLVVTSDFRLSLSFPKGRTALIDIYLDGRLLAAEQRPWPGAPADDWLQPTYIGQDDRGGSLFRGRLGRPVILNQRIVPPASGERAASDSVRALTAEVCGGMVEALP